MVLLVFKFTATVVKVISVLALLSVALTLAKIAFAAFTSSLVVAELAFQGLLLIGPRFTNILKLIGIDLYKLLDVFVDLSTGALTLGAVFTRVGSYIGSIFAQSLLVLLLPAAKVIGVILVIAATLYAMYKAFQYIEQETGVFSDLAAASKELYEVIAESVSGAWQAFGDIIKAIGGYILKTLIFAFEALATTIASLVSIFTQLSIWATQAYLAIRRFKGNLQEGEEDKLEKSIEKQKDALTGLQKFMQGSEGRLTAAFSAIDEGAKKAGQSMISTSDAVRTRFIEQEEAAKADALAMGDLLKIYPALDQAETAEVQKKQKLAQIVGDLRLQREQEKKLLIEQLRASKPQPAYGENLDAAEARFQGQAQEAVRLFDAASAKMELAQKEGYGRFLNRLKEFETAKINIEVEGISRLVLTDAERDKIRYQLLLEAEQRRTKVTQDAIDARVKAEQSAAAQIAGLSGQFEKAISIEKVEQLYELSQKLKYDLQAIKSSGLDVERRSIERTKQVAAEEIQIRIDAFEKIKSITVSQYNLRKEALQSIINLSAENIQKELQFNDADYLAEKVGFERRKQLVSEELKDRILQIRSSREFSKDAEHFITLAYEKESLERRRIAIEEAEARKRAISQGAAAARGFTTGDESTDLEIIEQYGLRRNRQFGLKPITVAERQQLAQAPKDRALQQTLNQIRNPLGQISTVAIDSLQQIQAEYLKIQQGLRASVDAGFVRAIDATATIGQVNQAFYAKLTNEAQKFPQYANVFYGAAGALPQGLLDARKLATIQESPGEKARRELLEQNNTALNSVTAALIDLTAAIKNFSVGDGSGPGGGGVGGDRGRGVSELETGDGGADRIGEKRGDGTLTALKSLNSTANGQRVNAGMVDWGIDQADEARKDFASHQAIAALDRETMAIRAKSVEDYMRKYGGPEDIGAEEWMMNRGYGLHGTRGDSGLSDILRDRILPQGLPQAYKTLGMLPDMGDLKSMEAEYIDVWERIQTRVAGIQKEMAESASDLHSKVREDLKTGLLDDMSYELERQGRRA